MINQKDKKEDCVNCSKKQTLFCSLTDEEVKYVNGHRSEITFNPGEIIFKQGTPMSHIACITKGLAKVYIEGDNNRRLIIGLIKPVYIIGGPGMWVDYMHHFSVSAIEETTACFINVEVLKTLVEKNTDFVKELLKKNNTTIIKHFNSYANLAQKNVHGRVADMLINLSRIVYESNSFKLTLSRQDLADYSAMSKEGVIRIIKDFKDQKLIVENGTNMKILNFNELERISRFG